MLNEMIFLYHEYIIFYLKQLIVFIYLDFIKLKLILHIHILFLNTVLDTVISNHQLQYVEIYQEFPQFLLNYAQNKYDTYLYYL